MRLLNDQQHATLAAAAATTTTDNQHTPQRHRASYNSKALPHLAEMLNQFFAIDVFKQPDTFPQNICTLCYNALEYFQQLCSVAEQSNEMLTRMASPAQAQAQLQSQFQSQLHPPDASDADADANLVGIYRNDYSWVSLF